MGDKLVGLGVRIDPQQIFDVAGRGTPTRMHVALTLLRGGHVKTINETFEKYIGDSGPAYVPKCDVSPMAGMEMILRAGGVPVLAHPGLTQQDGLIPYLVDWGLQGIEISYPGSHPADEARYLQIARKHNLLPSAGSDCHGERKADVPMGYRTATGEMLNAIRQRAAENAKELPEGVLAQWERVYRAG